ncbi:MAG: prephenate dehydrogenase/arogenate dehydrogenase family protein, partial [Candidatus Omnitrophica bacterium]|nr:prephenate dehydrogenase/arogenate dehydrogenase family protein [Candidatus Omnitrophota bacterium]
MKKNSQKILIMGLGLMGASLALAVRKRWPAARIAAVSRNTQALREAQKKGWIDEGSPRVEDAAQGVDFAVICTPVNAEAAQLQALDQAALGPILVTDVGSVKGELSRFLKKARFKNLSVIPAHPMVGSHEQGASAAREGLYAKGNVFLITERGQNAEARKRVSDFWRSLGMKVFPTDARRHDRLVAQISHLPHALAASLVNCVSAEALPFAASGFRDTTRIAAAHPSVWEPIFSANRSEVDRALRSFEKEIANIRKMIRSRKSMPLQTRLN